SESVEVDVRIIAATNLDLKTLAARNQFKQDLLDRLSFEVLFLPPLRERQDDIMLLAHHFAGRMAVELGWDEIPRFSPEAVQALEGYPWPGNVRELKNVVERAVYRADALIVSEIVFDPFQSPFQPLIAEAPDEVEIPELQPAAMPDAVDRPLKEAVWDLKIKMLESALTKSEYNQKKAAKRLGLTYHQFRGLYRQYQKKKTPDAE
ncbi:MAG: sigma 54-interacting transcriptional regulator, partial [Deltaproteobacteria bacterium]|nr:sigma 54-interacting transcriptional regulator [Deltaproteobacteria bacterium]